MNPKAFKKPSKRNMRVVKKGVARDAIGVIDKFSDTYILTYGQFSLIDALAVILEQTGSADVVLSSWTAADAHLDEAANMVEAMSIRSFRMIIDRSFQSRQPSYHRRMTELFGSDCVRAISSHAKFMVVTNENWNVVVRTSMNLNENPRFESIEISEDAGFAAFMLAITDEIFEKVGVGENQSTMPDVSEGNPLKLVGANLLKYDELNLPVTSHAA